MIQAAALFNRMKGSGSSSYLGFAAPAVALFKHKGVVVFDSPGGSLAGGSVSEASSPATV